MHDKADLLTNRTLLILNGTRPGGPGGDGHGDAALEQLREQCAALCSRLGMDLEFRQAKDEDQVLDWIASDSSQFDALILSPPGPVDSERYGAALEAASHPKKPVIEVHPDNVFLSDGEAHKPLQGPEGETGFVCGLGLQGYLLAIRAIAKRVQH